VKIKKTDGYTFESYVKWEIEKLKVKHTMRYISIALGMHFSTCRNKLHGKKIDLTFISELESKGLISLGGWCK